VICSTSKISSSISIPVQNLVRLLILIQIPGSAHRPRDNKSIIMLYSLSMHDIISPREIILVRAAGHMIVFEIVI
jgi:hypothetical protein